MMPNQHHHDGGDIAAYRGGEKQPTFETQLDLISHVGCVAFVKLQSVEVPVACWIIYLYHMIISFHVRETHAPFPQGR